MNPLALLAGSVVVGAIIALAVNQYLRRTATNRQHYSLRTHLFSAFTLVLAAAFVGLRALLDTDGRAFTIPFSVIVGLTGLVLLVRRTRDLNDSTKGH